MQGDKEQQTTNSERPPSRASPSLLLAPGKERRGGEKEFTGPRNPEGGESLCLTDRAQRPLKPFNTNILFENVPGQKTSESEMYLQLFPLPLLLSPASRHRDRRPERGRCGGLARARSAPAATIPGGFCRAALSSHRTRGLTVGRAGVGRATGGKPGLWHPCSVSGASR